MRTSIMVLAFTLFFFTEAQAAKTVIVSLDYSNSSPLVTDKEFAKKSAKRIYDVIKKLKYRDNVILRSFGEFRNDKNTLMRDFHLTVQTPPGTIARLVAKFITSFGDGKREIAEEKTTNILSFLEAMADQHSCSENEVVFILISDGLEYSELVNSYDIVKTGKGVIPQLEFADLRGCSLEMWGFGKGLGPVGTRNLKRAWHEWAKTAGIKKLRLMNDW